jgi:four helix bundle protein
MEKRAVKRGECLVASDNPKVSSYKDLLAWQKSILLVKHIYKLTSIFPREERFGLISQLRRAAVSVPSNIAEGQARRTTGDFIHFISNAEGSVAEIETQLIIAVELCFCSRAQAESCFSVNDEIRRMLNALRRSLESKRDR